MPRGGGAGRIASAQRLARRRHELSGTGRPARPVQATARFAHAALRRSAAVDAPTRRVQVLRAGLLQHGPPRLGNGSARLPPPRPAGPGARRHRPPSPGDERRANRRAASRGGAARWLPFQQSQVRRRRPGRRLDRPVRALPDHARDRRRTGRSGNGRNRERSRIHDRPIPQRRRQDRRDAPVGRKRPDRVRKGTPRRRGATPSGTAGGRRARRPPRAGRRLRDGRAPSVGTSGERARPGRGPRRGISRRRLRRAARPRARDRGRDERIRELSRRRPARRVAARVSGVRFGSAGRRRPRECRASGDRHARGLCARTRSHRTAADVALRGIRIVCNVWGDCLADRTRRHGEVGRIVFPVNRAQRALIFDLDGTLVDTVYAHVFAWQRAFAEVGLPIDGWRIHRRVGMSGGLFARAAAREIGRPLSGEEAEGIQRRHGELYREILPDRRPPPRAVELLQVLRDEGIPYGIATSGRRPEIDASLEALAVGPDTVVVERGDVTRAKPEPDLFLTCAERLEVPPADCYVVGDAVWDLLAARRAGMLSVGLLSGGYGEDELTRAGAFRVYRDAAELRLSLDELGVLS